MAGDTEKKPSRDIGAEAEAVIQKLRVADKGGNLKIEVTTRQLRKILAAVNMLNNKVDIHRTKEPGATALPEMEGEQYRKGAEASEKSRNMR